MSTALLAGVLPLAPARGRLRHALRRRYILVEIQTWPSVRDHAHDRLGLAQRVISSHWFRSGAVQARALAGENYHDRILTHHAEKGTRAPELRYVILPIG